MKAEDHAIGMGDAGVLLGDKAPVCLRIGEFCGSVGALEKEADTVRPEQRSGEREQARQRCEGAGGHDVAGSSDGLDPAGGDLNAGGRRSRGLAQEGGLALVGFD